MDKVFQQPARSGFVIVDRIVPGPSGSNALLWAEGVIRAVGPAGEVARQAKTDTPVFELPGAMLVAWEVDPAVHQGRGQAVLDAVVRLTVVDGEIVLQS